MSKIQSVMFKRTKFSAEKARKFLKDHGWKPIKRVHKTKNYLRYRLRDPKKFKRFGCKPILKGDIQLLFGFTK